MFRVIKFPIKSIELPIDVRPAIIKKILVAFNITKLTIKMITTTFVSIIPIEFI